MALTFCNYSDYIKLTLVLKKKKQELHSRYVWGLHKLHREFCEISFNFDLDFVLIREIRVKFLIS